MFQLFSPQLDQKIYVKPIYEPVNQPNDLIDIYKIFLPMILAPKSHYYAQVAKNGIFYGVWANIETADPIIREPVFSYASVNIVAPNGKWVEAGWIKSSNSDCTPKFVWAIQPGNANIIDSPRPIIGYSYQFMIEKISDGNW